MEKINQFSAQRFSLLIKRHFILNMKTWLIGLGAISGVLMMIALLQSYTNGNFNLDLLVGLGTGVIFIAGYLISSMAYNEIHTPARSQFYLTLPATAAEKLFSVWFLTSVVYIVAAFLMLSVILAASSGLSAWLFSTTHTFFNPLSASTLESMGAYVVTQSVFFLGALYFRKNNMLKTILSIFIVMLVLSLFAGLIGWLVFGSGHNNMVMDQGTMNEADLIFFSETLPTIARTVFWGLTAPFFLLVSYFRLKEREV